MIFLKWLLGLVGGKQHYNMRGIMKKIKEILIIMNVLVKVFIKVAVLVALLSTNTGDATLSVVNHEVETGVKSQNILK